MSSLFSTAGMKIHIGAAPMAFSGTDLIASDFNGVSWTEITGHSNLGSAGDTSELITFNTIDNIRTRKLKGTRNAGAMELVCGLDYADAGQIALIAAEKTKYTYPIRLTLNDVPPGGTPSYRYFVALVMSQSEQYDEANSVMTLNSKLEIDSNIVRVAASVSGSAPDNTALPTITGTAQEGETLTATDGTWIGTPTPSLSRQWFANGESLPGKTGTTLILTAGHVGKVITVMVTAVNYHGTAYAISAATSAVADD